VSEQVVALARIRRCPPIPTAFYLPETGDFTLGVASVLLLVGAALVPEVESLLTLLGSPEFGPWADIPLPELVVPGVP